MSKETLICNRCNAPVSLPLSVDEVVHDHSEIIKDDSIIIPSGTAWRIATPLLGVQLWFHPHSLVQTIVVDENTKGCCGYWGLENARCSCGNIVGNWIDECAHFPRFEAHLKNTYWVLGDPEE